MLACIEGNAAGEQGPGHTPKNDPAPAPQATAKVVCLAAVGPGNGVLLRKIDVAQVPVHVLARELEAEGGRPFDALHTESEDAFVSVADYVASTGLTREPVQSSTMTGPAPPRRTSHPEATHIAHNQRAQTSRAVSVEESTGHAMKYCGG